MTGDFEVREVDSYIEALGVEKREEIVEKLRLYFTGMEQRYTDIEGVELERIDFHFRVDGVPLVCQRTVKE